MVPAVDPPRHSSFHQDPCHLPAQIIGDYFPAWKVYRGRKPSELRLHLLTHVYYAFAGVAKDGAIFVTNECLGWKNLTDTRRQHRDVRADTELMVDGCSGALRALVNLKADINPDLKIVISVGGGSGSRYFADVAADEYKRKRFCESARDMVDRIGLDGIDVDWEHPSNGVQGESFKALLSMLRSYLPRPKYTITAALPAGEWCLKHIDLPGLLNGPSSVLDHVNIMAYDFAGSWTNGQSGHHASLHAPKRPHNAFAKRSISAITRYLTRDRKVDSNKIVMGIPVYGRAFAGVRGPGENFRRCSGSEGTYEYRNLPLPGAIECVDKDVGAASCRAEGNESEWVSYDNPATVAMKTKFVIEHELRGVFFWTSVSDSEAGDRSLVLAACAEMANVKR